MLRLWSNRLGRFPLLLLPKDPKLVLIAIESSRGLGGKGLACKGLLAPGLVG